MTEYLKKWKDKWSWKNGAFLCGLIYILIMAGMFGCCRMQYKGAAGGLIAAVFVVSLAAMAVMTVISYPVRREKEIMQECGQGQDGQELQEALYRSPRRDLARLLGYDP